MIYELERYIERCKRSERVGRHDEQTHAKLSRVESDPCKHTKELPYDILSK